jgi:hypothetical protein
MMMTRRLLLATGGLAIAPGAICVERERGNPNDPVAVYCVPCTRQIEKEHERHDREVEAFRDELDRFGSSSRPHR